MIVFVTCILSTAVQLPAVTAAVHKQFMKFAVCAGVTDQFVSIS